MPHPVVYTLKGLGVASAGGAAAFRDLWLALPARARVGVVGPAAGKTALLRIMAGQQTDFEGQAQPAADLTIGYLPPVPRIDAATVGAAVEAGAVHLRQLLRDYDDVTAELSSGPIDYSGLMERQGRLQQALDAAGAWRLDRRIAELTDALRLPPARAPVAALAPPQRRRVALCRLLLEAPDLLLLDEPADCLDAEAAAWLDRRLAGYAGTVVVATRDRCFLEAVADWILDPGSGGGAWRDGYAAWLAHHEQQLAAAGEREASRRLAAQQELDWLRAPANVRGAAADALLRRRAAGAAGSAAVVADGVVHGYGERALIDGLSLSLPAGAVAGVLGPAGAGKTTLLKLIAGDTAPDGGVVRLAPGVRAGWLAPPPGEAHPDPAGGLAALARAGVNLALLDEPAQHLDIEALRALEGALLAFPGSAVVATRDRRLLERVATHILAFEGDSRTAWFAGGYAAYRADRRRRLGAAADQPRRLRFRRRRVDDA